MVTYTVGELMHFGMHDGGTSADNVFGAAV
jgi:hypothetical protein